MLFLLPLTTVSFWQGVRKLLRNSSQLWGEEGTPTKSDEFVFLQTLMKQQSMIIPKINYTQGKVVQFGFIVHCNSNVIRSRREQTKVL